MTEAVTTMTPDQAVALMVPALSSGGAKIHSATSSTITGEVETKQGPSAVVAIVLLLIMILPGILYMIWGGKTTVEPFSITLVPTSDGTKAVASGQGRGLRAAEYAIGLLPRPT